MFSKPINRWWTVFAGAIGCAAGAGVVSSYVFGIFIKEISAEYGWDRSATTASISCFYIASGIGSVVLGSIMSRWSVRGPTMIFVSLFALSVISVAFLPKSIFALCVVFGVMGFFGSAATAMPYAVAISGWFDRNRGLALAVAVSGTGISAIFMSSYATWLMNHYGWRGGYIGVGVLVGLMALAGLTFFFRTPPVVQSGSGSEEGPSLLALFISSRAFWVIALPIFLISISLLGLITSLAPILTDRGESMGRAAAVLGLVGGASCFSRVGIGLLLDRVHVRYIAAGIFFIVGCGTLLIFLGLSDVGLLLGAILIGLGMGAEADLVTYAVSRYFSPRALGRALGGVWIFWAWGSGIGVFIGSLSYDLTGSYSAALALFLGFALLASGLIWRLGPYLHHAHEGPSAGASEPPVAAGS